MSRDDGMSIKEFFTRLGRDYRQSPDRETLADYRRMMDAWRVSNKDLDRLYTSVLMKHPVFYPQIGEIAICAREIGIDIDRRPGEPSWVLFNAAGTRYCVKADDLSRARVPDDATNVTYAPCKSQVAYTEQANKHEARLAFSDAFLEAGGKPELLEMMFNALNKKEPIKP